MKVKINKRLVQIGIGCIIVGLMLTTFLYTAMKRAAEPEPTVAVAYFSKKMEKDTILTDRDIQLKQTPQSLVPQGMVKNKDEVVGKRLITDVNKDEFVFLDKTAERGDVRVDVDEMWIIGIDVKDISTFLGAQLKTGDDYALIFNGIDGLSRIINQVKIVSLIDNTGKEILKNQEGVPKTINVAINTEEEMLEITMAKQLGNFEITRPPKEWSYMAPRGVDQE